MCLSSVAVVTRASLVYFGERSSDFSSVLHLPDNYTVCRCDEPVSKSDILPARAVLPITVGIA